MCNAPLVSICCLTYNHESFLRQCLDGFVMQKTSFEFEIVVHDDASTDGTREILAEYSLKYPTVFRLILQEENQYSKGVDVLTHLFSHAKGKYIAFCEGDDYWTDPLKLQKQVDFLENNPEFVLSVHRYCQYYESDKRYGNVLPHIVTESLSFDLQYYVSYSNWVTTPLTSMFRSDIVKKYYRNFKHSKDVALFYVLLKFGKGMLHKDIMGIYRIHNGGVWSSVSSAKRISDDLNTLMGIYEHEHDRMSASMIYNYIDGKGYLGITFLRKNIKLYFSVLSILWEYYGLKSISLFVRSINYIKRNK